MSSRQQALWGKAGQELLCNSKILITGLDTAGIEAVKTAAMLGVGTIYLVDDANNEGFFLDTALDPQENTATQLEKIVNDLRFQSGDLHENVTVEAFEEEFLNNAELIESLKPDVIFDFTGDISSQIQAIEYGIKLSQEKPIEVFIGDCDEYGFALNNYPAKEEDDPEDIATDKEIDEFEDQEQGVITSHLLSSLAIEYFRKRLFIKNKELFEKNPNNKDQIYQERGDFKESIVHSLLDHPNKHATKRNAQVSEELPEFDLSLDGKKILICGCGATGNPAADMLVRSGASQVDCLDYDKVENHNIERQPFFCGKIDELKAEVLSDKVKNIAKQQGRTIESSALVGKVCDKTETSAEKQSFNKDWFASQQYDIVLGCFDGPIARETLNKYAAEIGFTYIDCGSNPTSATMTAFIPGKTACLDCTTGVKAYAEGVRQEIEHRRQHSCTFNPEITPNVNMSNRIAAALMIAEAAKILNSDEYTPFSGRTRYYSNKKTFETNEMTPHCDLCKNDNTDGP